MAHAVQHEAVIQNADHLIPLVYTVLSCWTHFYEIGRSNFVVWDEAHFGKFGSHYLKREFYFDVHPPLGKMLVGMVGALSGYNGSFEFKSGTTYPAEVPFVTMRVMLSLFGVFMVPLAWYTAREMGMSRRAAHVVTLMTLCGAARCISHSDKWLTSFRDRRCLALHLSLHPSRLYAVILHLYHRLYLRQVPLSAKPVRALNILLH